MTRQSTTEKVEKLAKDAETLPATGDNTHSDDAGDLLSKLVAENDAIKEEMQLMKKRFHETVKTGADELKAEIKHHPMQSVATAFALGFMASLLIRR